MIEYLFRCVWLKRLAQVSFWSLVTTVILGSVFLISDIYARPFAIGGAECTGQLSTTELIVVPIVDVHCSGFSFADEIGSALKVLVNLEQILALYIIMTCVMALTLLFNPMSVSVDSLISVVMDVGIVVVLLAMNILAFMYALHGYKRLRASSWYRTIVELSPKIGEF